MPWRCSARSPRSSILAPAWPSWKGSRYRLGESYRTATRSSFVTSLAEDRTANLPGNPPFPKEVTLNHKEGTFQGIGELELYYQGWLPDEKPVAVLAIVHGFGEHCGRYGNLVEYLLPHGYAVCGLDHRGHGRSPGQRGHIDDWAEYRGDVHRFLQTVEEMLPGHPLFLLGHSLGALIVLDYLMHEPADLSGAIVSGAPIEPAGVAKPHLVALARLLSRVWPAFPLDLGLEASALSRNPEAVRAYEEDPLVHGKASARFGAESLDRVAWVKAHPEKIGLPLLMIHGSGDQLNTVDGTSGFFEQVTTTDKELLVYPGSYHEVHNDLDHQQLAADLEDWLARHLD